MKTAIWLVGALVFAVGVGLSALAAEGQAVPQTGEHSPVFPMPPPPRELLERMREMIMRPAGEDSQLLRHCRIVMRTPIFLDSPSAIRAQSEAMGLSADQMQRLLDIENEARQKARSLLTEEQIGKLGAVPDKAVALMDVCPGAMASNVEQVIEKIIGGLSSPQPPATKP